MIPKLDPPTLKDKKWSNDFRDFLATCLKKDPDQRPESWDLLKVSDLMLF
jgi:serine/threonine-protein kinase 24/25/MST4